MQEEKNKTKHKKNPKKQKKERKKKCLSQTFLICIAVIGRFQTGDG